MSSPPSALPVKEPEEEPQNRVLQPEKFFLMARHLIPSDKTIKALKPGATDDDGDGRLLMLWVKGGAHGWHPQYVVNGRKNTLSLGTYPDTGLALARRKADEARALVAAGTDPSEKRKAGEGRTRTPARGTPAGSGGPAPLCGASRPGPASGWRGSRPQGQPGPCRADPHPPGAERAQSPCYPAGFRDFMNAVFR
jgi:hypothetical protein